LRFSTDDVINTFQFDSV